MDGTEYRNVGNRKRKLMVSCKFDPLVALEKLERGESLNSVAKSTIRNDGKIGVNAQSIKSMAKRIFGEEKYAKIANKTYIKEYKERKEALLSEKHLMALEAITPEKLAEDSARDNAMTAKLLHEQLRLETNQSTQNIESFISIVQQVHRDIDDR